MAKHETADQVTTLFMLILLRAIDCKIVVLGRKGIFKCHNHRSIEEEKWKCHWLTSCLTDLLQKMEDSFRRKEMKGQRHEQRDDDIGAEFCFVNHKTHREEVP